MSNNDAMNSEIRFLEEVEEKLKTRITEINALFLEGEKQIESMHDYYWENYTEMDEYGYENYDNQQALLGEVNANNERLMKKQRLKKMIDSPYFGRVDFLFEGEEESESFYIGIGNFAPKAGMTPLIYDWRAPVSGLFYDYDRGQASYEAPGGTIEGEITSKWQYKIKKGKMVYAFESDTKIDDEILKQELGSNGDVQLKNIVRTIQKEQNEIIRNVKDKVLVIQGAAGSGKTSVALHRIAYLLYHDRKNLKASDILILSPNSVFADYISHILPELGEENIQEMSFDLFAYRELKGIVSDCEDRYDYLEKLIHFPEMGIRESYLKKQSAGFVGEMEGFLAVLEDQLMDFKPVKIRTLKKTEEELIHLFYFKFQDIPILARMDAVMEYLVDEYETLYNRNLPEDEVEEIREKFNRMYVTRDIYKIYNWFLEDSGYETLAKIPYENRKLQYEDVFPILYLKYRMLGGTRHKHIKHLVIDEMQDYSYLQYVVLSQLFSCRMTILGDRAQTLDSQMQDVLTFLPKIFGRTIRKIIMNKSYRNTIEIAEYAAKFTGEKDLKYLERHGKPVTEKTFDSDEELLNELIREADAGMDKYETAAVLTETMDEAYTMTRMLSNRGLPVNCIDRDSSTFEKGVTVTTFYMAKGLEFDQVFGVFPKKKNPMTGQAKYICATRALHELYMYERA